MLYYITGGERSGKSRYAQELALSISPHPIYVATSRKWDEDFDERVKRHKEERDERWTTIEEEKHLGKLNLDGKVAVIDCVTLWLTNFFYDNKFGVEKSLAEAKAEFDLLKKQKATIIIISNELGMGVHAQTKMGRKFVELQGWMNQYLATGSDKAIFMVSGIPLIIKGQ